MLDVNNTCEQWQYFGKKSIADTNTNTLVTILFTVYCDGHPINKLQYGIILLIFKIWKQNIGFLGNLIGHIYWNFL